MKKLVLITFGLLILLYSCKQKNTSEGKIIYQIAYELPDSLKRYAEFLPKEATVYFKTDSTISIQRINEESTTVITDRKTNFMRVLLNSPARQFMVDYSKADQAEEIGILPPHTITKQKETSTIAGYKALRYLSKDKLSDEITEMWFTKDVSILPNSLTMMLDTTLGVPLKFTINQNGMKTKTTVKSIQFEAVPPAIFSTPKGYVPLTPQQLRQMPVEN